MFRPPYCPNADCPAHRAPQPGFCVRNGSYKAKVRARRVPRFRCRVCRRSFSRQTFRADRYDHRPQLNGALLELLAAGSSLRAAARALGLSRRCTELKARKLLEHLAALDRNLGALAGPAEEGTWRDGAGRDGSGREAAQPGGTRREAGGRSRLPRAGGPRRPVRDRVREGDPPAGAAAPARPVGREAALARDLARRLRGGRTRGAAALDSRVSWRQDWGRRSLHPLTRAAESIEAFDRRRRRSRAAVGACRAASP